MKRRPPRGFGENGFESRGGYMAAKKAKLQEQFSSTNAGSSEQTKTNIFSDIAIFINGYTVPSADHLKQLMSQHGGTYDHYMRETTTHIIASNLPDVKIKRLRVMRIVKPDWIVESVKAGKLLDFRSYLLYSHESVVQPRLQFQDKTSASSGFLSEFYQNSRLHHLSTMGATFKQYVNQLREKVDGRYPSRDKLREKVDDRDKLQEKFDDGDKEENMLNDSSVIMHIDMDCFFVSVGLRNRPELRGLPVAVTHAKGNPSRPRSEVDRKAEIEIYRQRYGKLPSWVDELDDTSSMAEIASCSYEARKVGLKNGMFLGPALKLCPDLRTIPYDFEDYKEVSYILYDTVARYTLDIEAVSCDEMFVDCTSMLKETRVSALDFATCLRQEIKDQTGCPASTGFGSNLLQARMATKRAKPDGQFHLKVDDVIEFMSDINVSDLPGVGRSISSRLHALSVNTCQDLQQFSLDRLQKEFGVKCGRSLYHHCRGEDERKISSEHVRKSVSAEVNYGIRFSNQAEAEKFYKQLSEEVTSRLDEVNMKGRSITLKLMVRSKDAPMESAKFLGHGICDHVTKSVTLPRAVANTDVIAKEVMKIGRQLKVAPGDLRGIGIQVTRLESATKKGAMRNFLVTRSQAKRIPPDFDPEVFAALPEDIQHEVLEEHSRKKLEEESTGRNKLEDSKPGTSRNKLDYSKQGTSRNKLDHSERGISRNKLKDSEPEISRNKQDYSEPGTSRKNPWTACAEIEKQRAGKEMDIMQSELPVMSLNQMRTLIKEWINTECEPKSCDEEMLARHFQHLVGTRKIETLDLLIKCLYRCIARKNKPSWETAFLNIVNKAQDTMELVYGNRLYISETFQQIM